MPKCWIIAGPNGAGKTTFALEYLPELADGIQFINADLIAAGLSPLAPEKQLMPASRLLLQKVAACVTQGTDFALETTLSGRAYLKLVRRLMAEGWHVELIYLALPSIEMSRLRVAERVAHGGHHVSTSAIERRFSRSLANLLRDYSFAASFCQCFMNSGIVPELVFEQQGEHREVLHPEFYAHLVKEAKL